MDDPALFSALVIGNTEKTGPGVQRVYSHPLVKQEGSNSRKAPYLVFVRPSGAADGGFRLSIDNVLFPSESRTDSGTKDHECAFVSVLWEYNRAEQPGSYTL